MVGGTVDGRASPQRFAWGPPFRFTAGSHRFIGLGAGQVSTASTQRFSAR